MLKKPSQVYYAMIINVWQKYAEYQIYTSLSFDNDNFENQQISLA
jgi:hypothetical protein